jgi:hypothetical protein
LFCLTGFVSWWCRRTHRQYLIGEKLPRCRNRFTCQYFFTEPVSQLVFWS